MKAKLSIKNNDGSVAEIGAPLNIDLIDVEMIEECLSASNAPRPAKIPLRAETKPIRKFVLFSPNFSFSINSSLIRSYSAIKKSTE